MVTNFKTVFAIACLAAATQASAEVTFYEHDGFLGRSFSTERQIGNFDRFGFNDRASSVVVGRERWEVCDDVRFGGRCVVLRPGRYPSLGAMGLNDRVSSTRMLSRTESVAADRFAPLPVADYDSRGRGNERLYQAQVTSVRVVVGPPQQRCWVERQEVTSDRGSNSGVPGAIAGALIGGILGHQVGGGRGNDLATAGGAVAGAAVGARIGRDSNNGAASPSTTRAIQRCESVPGQVQPEYWDVSYEFRGQTHQIQMTSPPGPTVTVNRQGEPRT